MKTRHATGLPSPSTVSPEEALLRLAVLAVVTTAAMGQQQLVELRKRHLPLVDAYVSSIASGDVDGDGDLDLCFGGGSHFGDADQNRLLLNDGTGTFADVTAARMPVDADVTASVALADVDGDGDLDLVCGNGGGFTAAEQSRLYLNDGAGTFADATAGRMPVRADNTRAVTFGDVDGDGDLDLVCGNGSGSAGRQNRLYLNDGTGIFGDATESRLPIAREPTTSLAFGDVDGDGDLDLLVGNLNQQNRLYVNDGTGAFGDATPTRLPIDNDATTAVALADVEGDGDLDVVWANGSMQNRLYLNDGTGSFADVTATQMPVDTDETESVAFADVDGDGDPDLAFGDSRERNRLYLNDGRGSFLDATVGRLPLDSDETSSVAFVDIDGDGDRDLVSGNGTGSVSYRQQSGLYLNDGSGVFVDAVAGHLPPDDDSTTAVVVGDVDGDGDADLVFGNTSYFGFPNQNRLALNDGSGSFLDVTATHMPADNDETASLALGDVDGDGDLDLVCGNGGYSYSRKQSRLYLNDGTGRFVDATAGQLPILTTYTRAVAFGDVDGDGDLDLVLGNYQQYRGEQNRLFLNDGQGRFTDVTLTQLPAIRNGTTSVALGDVDGDGDLDLVCGNYYRIGYSYFIYGAQNRLYLNDGNGTFTDVTAAKMPRLLDNTTSVAMGDVDGDGDLDLVCGDRFYSSPDRDRLFLNDGTGTFTDVTATRMPSSRQSTNAIALGDLDDDGDLDIVSGSSSSNSTATWLYLNDGTGSFTDATGARLPFGGASTLSIVLADTDADGDLDLVRADAGQNRLYTNLLRQLDAPLLLRAGQPYVLEAHARYGPPRQSDAAFPFVSGTRLSIPVPPLGILGIDPVLPLPMLSIPPDGTGSITVSVPMLPSLIGVPAYAQALIIRSPIDARLSNVTSDTVLR